MSREENTDQRAVCQPYVDREEKVLYWAWLMGKV